MDFSPIPWDLLSTSLGQGYAVEHCEISYVWSPVQGSNHTGRISTSYAISSSMSSALHGTLRLLMEVLGQIGEAHHVLHHLHNLLISLVSGGVYIDV
jgi:hypothetical protein